MNAAEELAQLYAQWRTLTEEEGNAISHAQWPAVETCQSAKARLQPRIREVSAALEPTLLEARFRPLIDDLIRLEQENARRLARQRQEADRQADDCDRAQRSLRQLQRHYRGAPTHHWQSYS